MAANLFPCGQKIHPYRDITILTQKLPIKAPGALLSIGSKIYRLDPIDRGDNYGMGSNACPHYGGG